LQTFLSCASHISGIDLWHDGGTASASLAHMRVLVIVALLTQVNNCQSE